MKYIIFTIILVVSLIYGAWWCYRQGYHACDLSYQQQAEIIRNKGLEQTLQLQKELNNLKAKEKTLDAECQKIWQLNIAACRRRLHGN